VEILLEVAREHEPRFAPFLSLLSATGMRRGEALEVRWTERDARFDNETKLLLENAVFSTE
jgi:integrase